MGRTPNSANLLTSASGWGTLYTPVYVTTPLSQFGTPYFKIFIAWLVLPSTLISGADKTIDYGILFYWGLVKGLHQAYFSEVHTFIWDGSSWSFCLIQLYSEFQALARGWKRPGKVGRHGVNIDTVQECEEQGLCYSWWRNLCSQCWGQHEISVDAPGPGQSWTVWEGSGCLLGCTPSSPVDRFRWCNVRPG